jgi:hypothetical protein
MGSPEEAYLRFAREVYGPRAQGVQVEWDELGPRIAVFDELGAPLEPDVHADWWGAVGIGDLFALRRPGVAQYVVEHYAIPWRSAPGAPDSTRLRPYTGHIAVSCSE